MGSRRLVPEQRQAGPTRRRRAHSPILSSLPRGSGRGSTAFSNWRLPGLGDALIRRRGADRSRDASDAPASVGCVSLNKDDALKRFRVARVARLATVSADGEPHLVPVTFATWDDVVVIAVDHKPKTTTNLQRLRNIKATGRVSLLADEYDDNDWSRLWWVRVDGAAHVIEDEPDRSQLADRLRDRYEQYRETPPTGPVIRVTIEAVGGWAYRSD